MAIDAVIFGDQFARFQRLVLANDQNHPFTNFREGIAAVWESYKPRLRDYARTLLAVEEWDGAEIGTGAILKRTIRAIEIQDTRLNHRNNLVFWQNRFGHANRDHHALLDADMNKAARREIEALLFGLFVGGADEGATFDRLSSLTRAKYPLLAYLFFLKDMDRFMPIQPTGFDEAFRYLGVDLVTRSACSWENYSRYNTALMDVRDALATVPDLSSVRLIDAHSFCWMLVKLEDLDPEETSVGTHPGFDHGRVLGARERSIAHIKYSILDTAKNSRGQIEVREVQIKLKELRVSEGDLEPLIRELLALQQDRCALTGIRFQFNDLENDPNLRPSPDRIDSNGHYERGNIQLVCRFVNFWKGAQADGEFRRLLAMVRGDDRD